MDINIELFDNKKLVFKEKGFNGIKKLDEILK